jgi:hypothetical protein
MAPAPIAITPFSHRESLAVLKKMRMLSVGMLELFARREKK